MARGSRSWIGSGPGATGDGSEWTVGVDSSVIRAHQHAAGARHQPPKDIPAERLAPMLPPDPQPEVASQPEGLTGGWVELQEFRRDAGPARVDREGLGRSRGGLSTKIHLLADTRCRPLARGTTAGQRHDSIAFEPLMDAAADPPYGSGTTPHPPRSAPGRQGLLEPDDPLLPAATPDQGHHPAEERPAEGPPGEGLRRRAAARVRPRGLQAAQHHRARASTGSRRSAPSRCAPTSASSSTTAPSTSPLSESGSATRATKIHETRPSPSAGVLVNWNPRSPGASTSAPG